MSKNVLSVSKQLIIANAPTENQWQSNECLTTPQHEKTDRLLGVRSGATVPKYY